MRTEKTITIEDRGKSLTFKIKEMAATQLEAWTMRAVLLLADAGSDIPVDKGLEGAISYLSQHGFAALGKVCYERAKPLLDEMLGCCYRVVDRVEEQVTVETADAYIENMMTLFRLRLEAFRVNFDFFDRGGKSASPEDPNTIKLNAR